MLRSGWLSFTQRSPRRALARQLTRFSVSPGVQSLMSANSIPSLFVRATSLPVKTCVSAGRDDAAQHVLARIRAQLGPRLGGRLPGEQADRVARAQVRRPDQVPAPARGAQRQLELAPLAGAEAKRDRVAPLRELDAVRKPGVQLETVDRRAGLEHDPRRHLVAFERALRLERDVDRQPRRCREREPGAESEQERGGQRDELRPREHERGQQPHRRDARVRGELRRCVALHRAG